MQRQQKDIWFYSSSLPDIVAHVTGKYEYVTDSLETSIMIYYVLTPKTSTRTRCFNLKQHRCQINVGETGQH